jgi:hypothetical protein
MRLLQHRTEDNNQIYVFELENGNTFEIVEIDNDSFIMNNITPDCEGFCIDADSGEKCERKVYDQSILITPEG